MTVELHVETVRDGRKVTIVAEVRNGPGGQWFRSEVDIVEPIAAMDLPNALRQLGDDLQRNLHNGSVPAG
jgi:hypothetical protein